ncbi:hypothetical protein [Levilactobacillus tongjiangensis]|uniref:Uncharacterized protein n=1 Tax=Levilactobacillus tongjiangensis TaxID=2486023 RepID=A0ABW1SS58_9LACO|nr:hypothetical protein [Levilactobacillus tongjiangensis]
MKRIRWQRWGIAAGFYVFWWLRTVGWVFFNGLNGMNVVTVVESVGELLLLLVPWLVIVAGFARRQRPWVISSIALLGLTLLSNEQVSVYVAPLLPALTLLTGWLLANAWLGVTFDCVSKLVTGTVLVLTGLALLTPQSSARLYVAGYHSPLPAVASRLTPDVSNWRAEKTISFSLDRPVVADVGMLSMSGFPVSSQNELSVDVRRVGWVYLPTEDQWWVA